MSRILYELIGKDERRYSQFCWRIRYALAHKGLVARYEPCRHNDTEKLAFSGQTKVPVLVDGSEIIHDSWQIACYLDDSYPDKPSLMNGPQSRALTKLINVWTDTVLAPPLLRPLFWEIHNNLHPEVDKDLFRRTREARIGKTLEEMHSALMDGVELFKQTLAPIREVLSSQCWIAGNAPAYADYIVFGELQFARCLTHLKILDTHDPVFEWRTRMIELYDGLANSVPTFDP